MSGIGLAQGVKQRPFLQGVAVCDAMWCGVVATAAGVAAGFAGSGGLAGSGGFVTVMAEMWWELLWVVRLRNGRGGEQEWCLVVRSIFERFRRWDVYYSCIWI